MYHTVISFLLYFIASLGQIVASVSSLIDAFS